MIIKIKPRLKHKSVEEILLYSVLMCTCISTLNSPVLSQSILTAYKRVKRLDYFSLNVHSNISVLNHMFQCSN